jgi:hypothetical protein
MPLTVSKPKSKGQVLALDGLLQLGSNGLWQHGHHASVFTIENHQRGCAKDVLFGAGIGIHIAVPI